MKGKYWAYRDRKTRKRTFRYLWIQRLNAAARANGMTYSRLAEGLKVAGIGLDRKILADLAVSDETAFKSIVDQAKDATMKGKYWAYRDRKTRKRTFRYLWIQRLNAAARANGMTYSRLAEGLKAAGIGLDRKILADLAVSDETAFKSIVDQAKDALEKKNKKAA